MHCIDSLPNYQSPAFVISSLDRIMVNSILVIHESDHRVMWVRNSSKNKLYRTRLHRIANVNFQLNTLRDYQLNSYLTLLM